MVANFPGPYELRFTYTTLFLTIPLEHTQRINLDLTSAPTPGSAFNNINAKTRGGILTPDLAAVVEAWLTLIAERFEDVTTFGIVELWSYLPLTFDATFISAYTPVVNAGTDIVNATAAAGQEVYTFRTQEGGNMRLTLLETTAGFSAAQSPPVGNAGVDAIFAFVISAANWMLARDTSYPFANLRFLGGQNEKTFRQRYR